MNPPSTEVLNGPSLFGSLIESRREQTSRLRVLTLQIAVAVHAVVLGVVLVRSWLEVPPIGEPSLQVDFANVTPPPPPPPPAPPKPATPQVEPRAEVPAPTEMLQPMEMPEIVDVERIPEPEPSSGVEGGVEGGVKGGVLGGVPGGVVQEVGPYRIGGPATPPMEVHKVQPVYPRLAQTARVQGVVVLEALIRRDGSVADIRPVKTLSMGLTEAAIEAVRQWRYRPAELNGVPVEYYLEVIVRFTL